VPTLGECTDEAILPEKAPHMTKSGRGAVNRAILLLHSKRQELQKARGYIAKRGHIPQAKSGGGRHANVGGKGQCDIRVESR